MRSLGNILHLGIKELRSLRRDAVMVALIAWAFTFSVYSAAEGISHELHNAAVGIVDEDRSQLSERIRVALLAPYFRPPETIAFADIDPAMDSGQYTFVLVMPAGFEADVLAGRRPALQLDIDATAMMQAGLGEAYIVAIVDREVRTFLGRGTAAVEPPVRLETRVAFNPNLTSAWFTSVMELINNVTMLSMVLAGAALIREREHGTIEHLLVMPITPLEIMMAKIWANGVVILVAVALALWLVVMTLLRVPIPGSVPLFLAGTALYLFSSTAIGIVLATLSRSMPQFGLLFILVVLPMNLLSGGETPIESQPAALQAVMDLTPSRHFVAFAQAILYRGAAFSDVWPDFVAVAAAGAVVLALAGLRFRHSMAALRS